MRKSCRFEMLLGGQLLAHFFFRGFPREKQNLSKRKRKQKNKNLMIIIIRSVKFQMICLQSQTERTEQVK
jgi:hypothetical protein